MSNPFCLVYPPTTDGDADKTSYMLLIVVFWIQNFVILSVGYFAPNQREWDVNEGYPCELEAGVSVMYSYRQSNTSTE